MQRCKDNDSGHKKCNEPDRSDNIVIHTTYYFQTWKSIVSGKESKIVNGVILYG